MGTIMEVLVDQFVCQFGTPMQLHSDQGTNFQSNAFKEMCDYLSIDKTKTCSYRPQSNGNVERFHKTLATMLTMFCSKETRRWDEYLQQTLMAYRSSRHSSTGQIPNDDAGKKSNSSFTGSNRKTATE
jgi:transposase InsO family protein